MNHIYYRHLLLGLCTASLFACGGGGGGSSTNNTNNSQAPVQPQPTGIISNSDQALIAQPLELVLFYPGDTLSNIQWRQTAGTPLTLHADTSKVISVTPTTSGNYSFSVSFSRNGVKEQLNYQFSAPEQRAQLATYQGHAAIEGSKVSLRTYINDQQISSTSLKWQQKSGPTINFTESNNGKSAIFFTAPPVTQDTLLTFEISASSNQQQITDTVTMLVESAADIPTSSDTAYKKRLAKVFPFNKNSPYAQVLSDCTYSNQLKFNQTCTLNTLPLIAHEQSTPSIDDIMNRVLVSHKWMGQRFKEFLQNADPHLDFRRLLRATTAIVIAYDVRPSYYWAVTGAIHLDPNFLWQTPEERDTINQAPDFRAAFGNDLQFIIPWRYVENNQYASFSIPVDKRITRTAAEKEVSLASLMYHELAHANDFFPASTWASLNRNQRILDAVDSIRKSPGIQSDRLAASFPLNGQQMFRLAQVRFHGQTATDTEKAYSPNDVSGFFSPEQAPQFYSYSSKREDLAILFDGFMMKARYDVDRDVAITNQPSSNHPPIVTWGQRGRIGETSIKPRVAFVTTRLLPEFTQANTRIAQLPQPTQMTAGKTWAENLAISSSNKPNNSILQSKPANSHTPNEGMIFYEKELPIINKAN